MRKFIYLILTLITCTASAQSLRELYQEGLKAYEAKDYERFTQKMLSIDSMRPNFPAVVYNIAGGYALTGQENLSLKVLEKYILMDATQDFAEDKDFASILGLPGFEKIQKKQKELTNVVEVSKTFDLPLLASHPEAITYSKKQNAFFIGGVRDGKIWKAEDGKEPIVWAESPKNSWSVMGLEISNDQKTLWVCTSAMAYFDGYDQNNEGLASVLKYDLKNGKLLETYALPGGHNFGDLIADSNGNIYISDGTANQLYWINPKNNKLEVFLDLSKKLFNLQGLTFNETKDAIYISDYIDGIYHIELSSKEITKLKVEAKDVLIKGIDGIYYDNGTLLGLHNGTKPNRVIRYLLSKDGKQIIGKELIAQGGTLGEPTQGVWVNGTFHFIMNSPWGAYDRDENFNPSGNQLTIGIIK